VVIDDILISGGSVLEGIAKLESSGLVVSDVVVFLDHGASDHGDNGNPNGRLRLEQAGYRLHAVLDIGRITKVLLQAGRLSPSQARSLGKGAASMTS
jgi:uridine monophosphate synthetase